MKISQLDQNLRRFYAEARTKKGEDYSRSTLLGFRHSIERYLNAPPFSRGQQISTDPRFAISNLMLDTQIKNLKYLKKSDKENVEEEDLQKLKPSEVLSLSSPLSLLRNFWFHVVLFSCRRGLEGQRSLSTKSFKFETDAAERNCATMSHDELSKNHPGGLNDVARKRRMYETENQGDGYNALKLYLQKVYPKDTVFFQYAKKKNMALDAVWYEARPLGINSLAKMMKTISEEARLSKIYTNHCVRATAISLWSKAGISNRHIVAIS